MEIEEAIALLQSLVLGTKQAPGLAQTHRHIGNALLPTHDATAHTDRTRRIPVVFVSEGASALPATDAHGSMNTFQHWDFPDSATTVIHSHPIIMPADYVSGSVYLKVFYSTSVTTGNFRMGWTTRELVNGATSVTQPVGTEENVPAAGTANQINTRTIASVSNPTASSIFTVRIYRLGSDANDTATGVFSIWGTWIEYTADM
jgi:hypothetical protein